MEYEVLESRTHPGEWIVQAIGPDGEIYRTIFDYTDAESRAREYAEWKAFQSMMAGPRF